MPTRNITTKVAITGESEYRNSLKKINSEFSTLKSQLALVQSQFKDNANSMEALEAKGQALNAMYEAQKKKVETLQSALENAKRAQAAHAQTSDDLRKQLAEARAEMEKLKNSTGDTAEEQAALEERIGKLNAALAESEAKEEAAARGVNSYQRQANLAQAGLNDLSREIDQNNQYLDEAKKSADGCATSIDQYGKQVKEAQQDTQQTTNSIQDLADVLASAGIAAAADKIASKFLESAKAAASFADEIITLSAQTGISTQNLQKYSYASELVDVSVDTLTSTMRRNIKAMSEARDGSASYASAYERLGITVTNADGSLRSSEDVYWEVVDALGQMENETERDAVAMEILGKSAQDLNPLILAGSDAIKQFGEEAEAAGYVMSEETLSAAGALDDAMQRLEVSGAALWNTIGAQLVPGFEALTSAGVDVLQFATNFLQENQAIVPVLTTVTVGVGAYATAVAGLAIVQKIKTYLAGFNATLLANPYVLAAAAVATLTAAVVQYAASLKELPEETQSLIDSVAETAERYEQVTGEIADASAANKAYAKSIFDLSAQQKRSAADHELLLEQINRLNEAVPELNLAWDETTQSLNMTESAVSSFLETQDGYRTYEEAVRSYTDAENTRIQLEQQLAEAQKELAAIEEDGNTVVMAGLDGRLVANDAYLAAKNRVDELTAALEANAASQEKYGSVIEENRQTTDEYAESIEESLGPQLYEMRVRLNELNAEYEKIRETARNSIDQQIGAWQKMDNQSRTSAATLNEALLSQIDYLDNYSSNMDSLLARNVDGVDELAENFSDGSEESAAALAGLAEASDEEIEEIIANMKRVDEGKEGFVDSIAGIHPELVQEMDKIKKELAQKKEEHRQALNDPSGFEQIGIADIDGYIRGMQSRMYAAAAAAAGVSRAAQNAMKNTSQQKSPSKAYEKIANYDAMGYIRGWEKKRQAVLDEIKFQGETNLRAMQARFPTHEAIQAGFRSAENNRISEITSSFSSGNSEMSALLSSVNRKLDRILSGSNSVPSYKIYLDDGVLAGHLAPAMDDALGDINRLKERGQ